MGESLDRRKEDANMHFVIERITDLKSDITDLKDSMREMASAINRLVAVETKQDAMNQSYDRIVVQLEKEVEKEVEKRETLESRVDALEKEQPDLKRLKDWFYKGVLAILAVVGIFILKFVGLY